MKLVISGSQSFIGRELIRLCGERGIEWHGLDARPPAHRNEVRADIRQPGIALPPADALVHLAAISRDADCRRDPASAFAVNVGGTLHLLDAAVAAGIPQVVFASSEWVYPDAERTWTEEMPIDAGAIRGEYALSKLTGERLVAIAAAAGRISGTVLRFGIVYGPRLENWSAVEALYHAVATRDTVEVGSLSTARRFIHVRDVAEGIAAAVGRRGFEVFNLSGDSLIRLADVIEASNRVLHRRVNACERDAAHPSVRDAANHKARRELGWAPRIDLEAGLRTLGGDEEPEMNANQRELAGRPL